MNESQHNLDRQTDRQTDRNYGIDLLRIVSMVMIVVLHVLGHGKLLESVDVGSLKYNVLWFMETMAYCAVNCYGLISGYVGYGKRFKLSNLFYIWMEVVFYSIGIALVFKMFNSSIGFKSIISSFFPVTLNAYWYFSAYVIMFIFTPFFNFLIERLSKRKATLLVGCIIILASILQLFVKDDYFALNAGYTALWLSALYIIGAYIKKYNVLFSVKKRILFLVYLICVFISFGYKFALEITSFKFPSVFSYITDSNLLIQYNSPTILLCGIVLLLMFSKLRFNKGIVKLIALFAPAAFGVYLIHDNQMMEKYVMPQISEFKDLNAFLLPCVVIGLVFAIWLICSLIDIARIRLFKLIKVKQFSVWFEKKVRGCVNAILCKMKI